MLQALECAACCQPRGHTHGWCQACIWSTHGTGQQVRDVTTRLGSIDELLPASWCGEGLLAETLGGSRGIPAVRYSRRHASSTTHKKHSGIAGPRACGTCAHKHTTSIGSDIHQDALAYLLKMASSSCMFPSVRCFTHDLWVATRLHRPRKHATHSRVGHGTVAQMCAANTMDSLYPLPWALRSLVVPAYLVTMDAICSLHPG